ncbi:M23 family metallopeptidase [Afifella marina]|uniref:Murein DD-endopeptidase MepM and murein hydrolase activator NlpD, contain LysM domain n=1 Tax=Afifella marina DSM 2698 TaxID=1120955 RepID=A0A1G5P7L0_AFIMA|nr:M23 family metallopeptidase [Afifella marina]MBK1624913.1 hypothetical protein [Afifella marina DSM 2698]MBK1628507.1 hypothetical protein [Afifella marina]MBK5917994.1 hypothetical protein [Afifella marina]RAI18672.1 hypothetical protein CH311_14425 [Afifella marina DSM 2698]SCZ45495.1 Murein DD-endopeptidase MepM and murein hydrolase activator NlpD, contain LysM domain [Afifella marina DSM 2698]
MRSYRQSASFWFTRISALALITGLGAGCSADAIRLTEPIYTGSTANQQQTISAQANAYQAPQQFAAPSPAVQSRQLPPPSGGYQTAYNYPGSAGTQQSYSSAPTSYPQQQASAPKPYTPPKPYAPSGMPKPLGKVTVDSQGTPQPRRAEPAVARTEAPQPHQQNNVASSGGYTVRSGDSLWSIAHAHGVTTSELASANNIEGGNIRPGQTLKIPSGGETQVARVDPKDGTMSDAQPEATPEVRPEKTPVSYTPPSAEPKQESAAPAADTTAKSGGAGFRWPVHGRIIAEFGSKPNGERNDGINLAVPEGTAVKAAEDGTVIYSGNELKSYGNLILVRHEGGWVSAYAHNSELLVKRGEKIRRGQIIAKSGMSGNVTSPQVHFELRKGATPVNPVGHMASA